MSIKFVLLSAFVAAANAGLLGTPAVYAPGAPLGYARSAYAAPLAYAAPAYAKVAAPLAYAAPAVAYRAAPAYASVVKAIDTDFDPNPAYSYSYDIQDALTGDVKSQQESRQGDAVQGSYSLIESDGTRRTVDYTADDVNGFNAVVRKEPLVQKVAVVAPVVAKYAAPAYASYAAPAYARAAPAYAPLGYAAPAYGKAYLG